MAFYYTTPAILIRKMDFWQTVFGVGVWIVVAGLLSLCGLFLFSLTKTYEVLPKGYYCGLGLIVLGVAILAVSGLRIILAGCGDKNNCYTSNSISDEVQIAPVTVRGYFLH